MNTLSFSGTVSAKLCLVHFKSNNCTDVPLELHEQPSPGQWIYRVRFRGRLLVRS